MFKLSIHLNLGFMCLPITKIDKNVLKSMYLKMNTEILLKSLFCLGIDVFIFFELYLITLLSILVISKNINLKFR